MPCEAEGGFQVEVLELRVVEFQLRERFGFVEGGELAVVEVAVDRPLVDVGLHQPVPARGELGDAAACGRGGAVAAFAQRAPELDERGLHQAQHRRRQLDASEQLAEVLLEAVGAHVHRPAATLPAVVVAVAAPAPAARPGGCQRPAATLAADEAAQRKVGVLVLIRLVAAGAAEPHLDAGEGAGVDDRLVLAVDVDPPHRRPDAAGVERVAEHADEVGVADDAAPRRPQAKVVDLAEDLRRRRATRHQVERGAQEIGPRGVGDDRLLALGGAAVEVAGRCEPRPAAARHRLAHAGGDLVAADLVVELVEDGEDALDRAAGGGVVERLRGGAEAGAALQEELPERLVDELVARPPARVVDDHRLDAAAGAAEVGEELAQLGPVGRARRLALLPIHPLDEQSLAGAVVAAGSLLDVEREVGNLLLGGDAGVDEGARHQPPPHSRHIRAMYSASSRRSFNVSRRPVGEVPSLSQRSVSPDSITASYPPTASYQRQIIQLPSERRAIPIIRSLAYCRRPLVSKIS
ncbi:MAG TPA: hypothetical protein VNJ70_18040 [Thermoanaerobaculia bacterium]|nr:hypothetical protein [Thermoanaerobaculia bacterium]